MRPPAPDEAEGDVFSPGGGAAPAPVPPPGPRAIAALVVSLTLAAARNRWRRRMGRLRQPRYLLALLAGGAYLYFVIVRQSAAAGFGAVIVPWAETLTALGFTALAATWWLAPTEMSALAFTPPEAHLLFPAPVTRRTLLVWKVLRAQGAILLSTVLWIVLLRGGVTTGGWMRALALWGMFSAMHLHRLAVQLAHAARRERDEARGVPAGRGWKVPLALALLAAAIGLSLWEARDALAAAGTTSALGAALGAALERGPATVVLAPARAAVGPLFATGIVEWAARVPLLVALLAAHYAWVFARDVPFEETALRASTALAERVAEAQRRGRRRAKPVVARGRRVSALLGAAGAPATAIVWKNVLGWVRGARPGIVLLGAAVFGLINVLIAGGDVSFAQLFLPIAVAVGVLLVMFGPGVVRADLRQDLAMLEVVRGWPLPGRAIVRAEVWGATLLLLALQLGYALLVAAGAALAGQLSADVGVVPWAVAIVGGLAVLDLAHVSLYNLVAVLFPDWVRPDRERMGGIEATGQGMLLFLSLLVALLLLLVLPAMAGALAALLVVQARLGASEPAFVASPEFWLALGPVPALAGVAAGALVLLAETWGVTWWAGRTLDRMEPLDNK